MAAMIEFEEACELIFSHVEPLGTEEHVIEEAMGYALAQDIVSPIDIAPFRNSAMDGFAVKSSWLTDCSLERPVVIPISSTSFAGKSATRFDASSQALKVMTGARVPDAFDAVVPFEATEHTRNEVRFVEPAAPGQHIRPVGEDVVRGQKLFAAGTGLTRLDIGILASVGLRRVATHKKPSMTVIGTGDELTNPGESLTGDQLYDANTFSVTALTSAFCSRMNRIPCVPDKPRELEAALRTDHTVVVTCGGVSAGERDLIPGVAEACGWRRVFHKARIKPGKPIYFAVRNKQVLFGLPGNPLSAAVTCAVFVIPALKKLAGFSRYRLHALPAVLEPESVRKSDRKLIWPGTVREEKGIAVARLSQKTSSAALTALLGTDGLIIQDAIAKPNAQRVDAQFIPWNHIVM